MSLDNRGVVDIGIVVNGSNSSGGSNTIGLTFVFWLLHTRDCVYLVESGLVIQINP